MRKKLSPYESILWLMGRYEPFLIQWTLMLSGDIKQQHVEQALHLVQQQHPLLNCTINAVPPFEFSAINKPIRLTLHPREHDSSWEKIALQAVSKPLPLSADETFLTVDWVSDNKQHEFIFTIDHGFSDLRCLTGIGTDFLTYLDQLNSGVKDIKVKYYPQLPASDTLLPINKSAAPLAELEVPFGDQLPLQVTAPYQYKLPYVHELSVEHTQQLIDAARQQQCSLHGMLCAAMTHALNNLLTTHNITGETFCFTPGDLRPYLNAKISGKDLGNFAVGIFHPFQIGKVKSFWDLARHITQQVKQAYETSGLVNGVQGFASLFHDGMSAEELAKMVKIRNMSAAVSNVGAVTLSHYKHFKLLKARFGSASPIMSGRDRLFWLGVEIVHDRLQLEFLRTNPHGDLAEVKSFAQDVVGIITAATSSL